MVRTNSRGGVILLLLITAGCLLFNFVALRLKDYRVGDLGLGVATTTKTDYFDSLQINQIEGGYEHAITTMKRFEQDDKTVCLLFGNSQLHSINYQKKGDHLAVYYLNERANTEQANFRAVQLSSPNINFQEMLLYYLTLKRLGIKPAWVVIGCTYRTFQLTSLREKFREQLRASDPYLDQVELKSAVRQFYKDQVELVKVDQTPVEQGTWQEETEKDITHLLEENWEAYQYRGNVRSRLKVLPGMIYRSTLSERNFYEGSETTEALNMLFLRQLVELCEGDGVNVLLYKPPHPQSDEPFQYNRVRYNRCFSELQLFAEQNDNVYFRSYETIIPLKLWGKSNSGRLDVFHFKTEGHQLLANEIFNFLREPKELQHAVQ